MHFWRYERNITGNIIGSFQEGSCCPLLLSQNSFSFFSSYNYGTLLFSFVLCHLDPYGTSRDHLDQPLFPEITIYIDIKWIFVEVIEQNPIYYYFSDIFIVYVCLGL